LDDNAYAVESRNVKPTGRKRAIEDRSEDKDGDGTADNGGEEPYCLEFEGWPSLMVRDHLFALSVKDRMCDISPELMEFERCRVVRIIEPRLRNPLPTCSFLGRVVEIGDADRGGRAKDIRVVERSLPQIRSRHEQAAQGVACAPQEATALLTHHRQG
jgi:hypothetical protein